MTDKAPGPKGFVWFSLGELWDLSKAEIGELFGRFNVGAVISGITLLFIWTIRLIAFDAEIHVELGPVQVSSSPAAWPEWVTYWLTLIGVPVLWFTCVSTFGELRQYRGGKAAKSPGQSRKKGRQHG